MSEKEYQNAAIKVQNDSSLDGFQKLTILGFVDIARILDSMNDGLKKQNSILSVLTDILYNITSSIQDLQNKQ